MAQLNSDLTAALNTIAERRFVFVHQSVGRDLLRGITEIAESANVGCPPIIEATAPDIHNAKGILHARLGRNREPETKLAAFRELMTGPLARTADAATVKLCYVDISSSTDAKKLFELYRGTLQEVADRAPSAHIFAMTVPLTTIETALTATVRGWLGRPCTQRDDNLRRHEFNELIRESFTPERLFDIARFEATNEAGVLCEFLWQGRKALTMHRPYTNDGGHLNDLGRRHLAVSFTAFLGSLRKQRDFLEKS